MKALWLLPLALLAGCSDAKPNKTRLVIQRFFGACEAEYGRTTDIAKAEGECGIMTAMINRFEAENPDIHVVENVVFWPGYDQLTAQLAANDAPDLVTMHGSVIADYQARDLLEPLDADLTAIGAPPASLTTAARTAVTVEGHVWGLPIDTWAPLWHINMNLFRKAGLVRNGKPILPRSPEELYAHAQQFRERTGKPYLVQGAANEYAGFTRNFYTFVMQQNGTLFRDGHATFATPEGRNALQLFKTIYDRDFTTKNQDYSAAVAGFLNGDGGVFLVGTWMVGTFDAKSRESTGALANGGYTVMPYPKLFQREATFADGHNWVMPRDSRRTPEERAAALRFLKFFAGHAKHWARTGHLPAFQSIIDSPQWRALPHRGNLAILATTAQPLPKQVRRQFPLETIVGTEAASAISGAKPIDRTLSDMERRANEVLDNL
ncbi:extracellular solute-binding protein [Sphingomonas sp. LM7]|uniref:extracellular solute-binding protein n=1 Tax=Sphingomonas sp. LM7 TaxID=1938607 RepID=UPI000983C6E3|nr:extracellular solute-binding protein [Sphingomonas sp. LM7]AQR73713.1 sugar ABC transporter substrate-binding protein [Sphingomonas sp. LM7]